MANIGRILGIVMAVIFILALLNWGISTMDWVQSRLKMTEKSQITTRVAQLSLLNVLDSINRAEDAGKVDAVNTMMMLVGLSEDCQDPLDVALSGARSFIDGRSLDQVDTFMKNYGQTTTLTEIAEIESIEASCDTWKSFAEPGATEFEVTSELKNSFYKSLTGGSSSLSIISPLGVPQKLYEKQDLVLSRYCVGDCEYTRACIACWELYEENKNNVAQALDVLQEARCADSCARVCEGLKASTDIYKKSLSAATADEKSAYLAQFIETGLEFR